MQLNVYSTNAASTRKKNKPYTMKGILPNGYRNRKTAVPSKLLSKKRIIKKENLFQNLLLFSLVLQFKK